MQHFRWLRNSRPIFWIPKIETSKVALFDCRRKLQHFQTKNILIKSVGGAMLLEAASFCVFAPSGLQHFFLNPPGSHHYLILSPMTQWLLTLIWLETATETGNARRKYPGTSKSCICWSMWPIQNCQFKNFKDKPKNKMWPTVTSIFGCSRLTFQTMTTNRSQAQKKSVKRQANSAEQNWWVDVKSHEITVLKKSKRIKKHLSLIKKTIKTQRF